MIVDAHQHFWDPARGDYGWLAPDSPIHRRFATDDLRPLIAQTGVNATILVQAAPTVEETDYLLAIGRRTAWVLGVVGWIDLAAADAVEEVRRRAADPLFLGVRPMLQDLPDPDWILRPELVPALHATAAEGLVFDALVRGPDQLGAVIALARQHPQLSIVLDHAGKPRLGDAAATAQWQGQVAALAALPNVTCKVSGLLTELQPGAGTAEIGAAIAALAAAFGPQRLLWGSDWPVLTMSSVKFEAGDYAGWFALARDALAACAPDAVGDMMGRNAVRIYRPDRSRTRRA